MICPPLLAETAVATHLNGAFNRLLMPYFKDVTGLCDVLHLTKFALSGSVYSHLVLVTLWFLMTLACFLHYATTSSNMYCTLVYPFRGHWYDPIGAPVFGRRE